MGWEDKHDAVPLVSDAWKKSPGKKNTKRWCRGKEGREHTPELVMASWAERLGRECSTAPLWRLKQSGVLWSCFHRRECSTCGKVLDHFIDTAECPTRGL